MSSPKVEPSASQTENIVEVSTDHNETRERGGAADLSQKSISASDRNLTYDQAEDEPEIHLRTYLAVAAMLMLNFVQIIALLGPPVVLDNIAESLDGTGVENWVPNALSLVQAVVAPVISSASDAFQARKLIMVISSMISFVGAAIAPGSQNIYRLIGAQILIGFGFASTGLAYCVPSEILPRKWRPLVQSIINLAAALAACSGPIIIGAFTRNDPMNGWRNYWWFQMAVWGLTAICIFIGYKPPKRHTRYDHLSFFQKATVLDLPGAGLFAAGLTLLLVGLTMGGVYTWTDSRVLGPLVSGIVTLIAFILYEWKGTKTGLAHHDLFTGEKARGRNFAIFLALIFIEGILLFSYMIFYPKLTIMLFTDDTLLLAARGLPFWLVGGVTALVWGFWSMRAKSIRVPLFFGFLILTAGIAGLATIQPGDSINACVFAGLAGIGFGAPLILIIAGIQLAVPHTLIATGTALSISCRAVSASVFTAIFAAAVKERLEPNVASYIAKAALSSGLPARSVPAFIGALANQDITSLTMIPGITPQIIAAGVAALKQAFADSIRIVFVIAAPFGALACILCFFLADQSEVMDYRVDAPVEDLHAHGRHIQDTVSKKSIV